VTAKNPGLAFDPPEVSGPCGCANCQADRNEEADRERHKDYGYVVLGGKRECLRPNKVQRDRTVLG
jgi:hypothetical protein